MYIRTSLVCSTLRVSSIRIFILIDPIIQHWSFGECNWAFHAIPIWSWLVYNLFLSTLSILITGRNGKLLVRIVSVSYSSTANTVRTKNKYLIRLRDQLPINVMTLDRWVGFVRMVDAWGVHAKQTCSARSASKSRWNRDNIKRSCYRLVGRHGGFVSTFQSSFLVAPAESRATYLFTLVSVCLFAWLWHLISSIATRWLKKFQFNFKSWQ